MNAVVQQSEFPGSAPLAACGIRHGYQGHEVLRGVDLELGSGSVLGLIGRNGAGKSTLIRIMLGLAQPQAGTARVFGQPALALSDSSKQRLAYVPQQPDTLPTLSPGQMFEFMSRFYPRWDHAFCARALARWGILPDRAMGRLSPGERQRVELIRALASSPDLLVLDEPAAALDPVARRDLLREIALRASDTGTSVLFSSHIVSDLERVASRVAMLCAGHIVLHCPVDACKEDYARLVLPAGCHAAASDCVLSRNVRTDGRCSLVVRRDKFGNWPGATDHPDARLEPLGLEDLFVEIAG